jgi:DNA-binding transcriptional LysR family regulator
MAFVALPGKLIIDMVKMHGMNIATIDLNLLKAFEALMIERAVTRAANRIGLSQPAMSHALSRLRHLFEDELFVRTPSGMEPTAKARLVAEQVTAALDHVRSALDLGRDFDPATAGRSFSIGVTDHAEMVLLESIVQTFVEQAPHADLRIFRVTKFDLARQLDEARIDVAIGRFKDLTAWMSAEPFIRDPLVLIARAGHPVFHGELSLARYLELTHLLVSPSGELKGAVDRELAAQGLVRRMGLVSGSYLAVPLALARSDLVSTVPGRVAQVLGRFCDIGVRSLPFEHVIEQDLVWHRRDERDPAHIWLRSLLHRISGSNEHSPDE